MFMWATVAPEKWNIQPPAHNLYTWINYWEVVFMKIDINDIVGKKFNRLLVLSYDHSRPHPNPTKGNFYFYKCQCECGNIRIIRRERIINGITKSCGCLGKEIRHQLLATKRFYSHRLYQIWCGMKYRCYNPNNAKFSCYGGRGIIICKTWLSNFDNFYNWAMDNGYNDKLSIERIDVNGNYEPSNCTWANDKVQANNRTNSHLIFYNDETHTISEWSEILRINRSTLWYRIKRGWSIERAFTTPVN